MWAICNELTGKSNKEQNTCENVSLLSNELNNHLISAVQQLLDKQQHCKIKTMWAICNELTGKSNKEQNTCENVSLLSNELNNHLISAVQQLLDKQQHQPFNCDVEENNQSMYLKPISIDELIHISQNLKNRYCCGYDGIPVNIV
ncbi:hypothetical protein QE152_g35909 [Popillia japonica]|uniref:Uncharacterized protein n=1 Tax=Popillia japonica TaxID=7064 RepID=A0AAW1IEA5_POPJA